MPRFRPHPARDHLNAYWNARTRGATAEELAALAEHLDRHDIAAIDRAHALHRRRRPDPAFAARLESTLMAAFASTASGSIPLSDTMPPSANGRHAPAPTRPRTGWMPSLQKGSVRRNWVPALEIAMVIFLLIASAFGIWLAADHGDEPSRIVAPAEATPTAEASPGWTHFKGDAARRGETNFGPVNQPVELWRHQANGPCIGTPALVGATVYAACEDGVLYALDALTGDVQWEFATEPLADGPSVADGVAYVVGSSGALYAVETATGTERWRYEETPVQFSPAVADGVAVVPSPDGLLVGIDAATGEEQWRYQVTTGGNARTPALAEGIAYAGSETGEVVAVDANTGQLVWRADSGDNPTSTATVADGITYITGTILFAYDAKTGALLWQSDDGYGTPSVSNGIGYSGNPLGEVYAVDLATREILWQTQVGPEVRPFAATEGLVYVPSDGDRTIYAYDTASGAELWRLPVDGTMLAGPAIADGRIYIATMNGVIQAFGEGEPGFGPGLPSASPAAMPEATPDATPVGATATMVGLLWQSTGGPEPLHAPTGMAIAPDGNLWVVDGANNRFQIFSPDGEYLETWGTTGNGEGEFNFNRSPGDPINSVGSIAFTPDGSFYVAESANHRVQKFDANRQFVLAWGSFGTGDGQFSDPYAIAVAPDGNVYVIDDQRDDIQVFDSEGTFLFKFAEHGTGHGQLNYTGALTIDSGGSVYVSDFGNHRVQKFAADGTFIATIGERGTGEGQFNGPGDVAIDQNGYLYVTEAEGGRVQVFNQDGEYLLAWSHTIAGQELIAPIWVAVDDAGGVFVTDVEAGTVQKYLVTFPDAP